MAVMLWKNILFKIAFPAEFHAQTAVECAFQLHNQVKDCIDEIDRIEVQTQEAAMRIINKTGPLHNPADRDHCLQYMIAIGLLFGELTAEYYEDKIAADSRINVLRDKMLVTENKAFTKDYLDPEKRSIGNAIQIFFKDGSSSEQIIVEYPIGHRRRRKEGIPLLLEKFKRAVTAHFPTAQATDIQRLVSDRQSFKVLTVSDFMKHFFIKTNGKPCF